MSEMNGLTIARVGFCFHPSTAGAEEMARRLTAVLPAHVESWLRPIDELSRGGTGTLGGLDACDLLVCVGGDGTMLQAAGIAAEMGTPVFGVRMGRLGFLAEATEGEAEAALRLILDGDGHIERRTMVQARVGEGEPRHALNDVVIGRAHLGRTVSVGVRVGGVLLAEYRADAVLIATATGSTGYSLAVGGPILHPGSQDLIVTAVAPHLSYSNALVIPGDEVVTLEMERSYGAVMIVDGLHEEPIENQTLVQVTRSPLAAQFIRLGGPHQFYANLAKRLGWLRLDHVLQADPD